jgi:gamma-glutamylcyclotransferase (GGCT)/AIG2-like uncharacterized protein YtfP
MEYLFVYGTLQPRLNHAEPRDLIADLESAGRASVPGDLYDLGSYPGLVPGLGRVQGELLIIEDHRTFTAIDAYEECGGERPLYRRERTVATRSDGTAVAAWVYVFLHLPAAAVRIASGDYAAFLSGRATGQSAGGLPGGQVGSDTRRLTADVPGSP